MSIPPQLSGCCAGDALCPPCVVVRTSEEGTITAAPTTVKEDPGIRHYFFDVDTTAGDIDIKPDTIDELEDGDRLTFENLGPNSLTFISDVTGHKHTIQAGGVITLVWIVTTERYRVI